MKRRGKGLDWVGVEEASRRHGKIEQKADKNLAHKNFNGRLASNMQGVIWHTDFFLKLEAQGMGQGK